MTIHAATTLGPVSVRIAFLSGEQWAFNSKDMQTVMTTAIHFLEKTDRCRSWILAELARRGFPNGDPTKLSRCKCVRFDTEATKHVEGTSIGVATVLSVMAEAMKLLTALVTDVSSATVELIPDIVATGIIDQWGKVVAVDKLSEKIAEFKKWRGKRETLLIVPAAQLEDARREMPAKELRAVGAIEDCLAVLVGCFSESIERWQKSANALFDAPFDWDRVTERPWNPRPLAAPIDAVHDLIISPAAALLAKGRSLRDVFGAIWSTAKDPLPEGLAPGEIFDRLFLRFAAATFVMSQLQAEKDALSGRPAPASPSPPPSSRFPKLDIYRAGATTSWTEREWLDLVQEAGSNPDEFIRSAGPAAAEICRIAKLAEPKLTADDRRSLQDFENGCPKNLSPSAQQMPVPIRWDLESFLELWPTTSVTGPIVHAWITRSAEQVEEILLIGRGSGHLRRELEGLILSTCLQAGLQGFDFFGAGITILRDSGPDEGLHELPAALVGLQGAFFRASQAASAEPTQRLTRLVEELQNLATQTKLVVIHDVSPAVGRDLFNCLAKASHHRAPAELQTHSLQHEEEAVVCRPLLFRGRPDGVGIPPFLFETPPFRALVSAYGSLILDRVTFLLERRIQFYLEIEGRCRDQMRRWANKWAGLPQAAADIAKSKEPVVWMNSRLDLASGVEVRIPPEAMPAQEFYEKNVPGMQEQALKLMRQMVAMKENVSRSRATVLPLIAASLFADAALRHLDPTDIVIDCPAPIADAYRTWAREAQPVLESMVESWARRRGLSDLQRERVLTRHVVWRLTGGSGQTALVPHAIIHTPQSKIVHDAQRQMTWAIHPLDWTRIVHRAEAQPEVHKQVQELVERAVAAERDGETKRSRQHLDDAVRINFVLTLRALHASISSAPPVADASALAKAKRRMLGVTTLLRCGLPLSKLEGLVHVLCKGLPSAEHRLPEILPKNKIEEDMQIPELPLKLERFYRIILKARPTPPVARELEAACRELVQMAKSWDDHFVDVAETSPDSDSMPPSAAFASKYKRRHLTAGEDAAYSRWRARELFNLVRDLSVAVEEMRWSEDSIRRLYLEIGDFADRMFEDFPEEAGAMEARRLIELLPAFELEDAHEA